MSKRTVTQKQFTELCSARDKLCGFCEADKCEKCIVTRLIDDVYNELPDNDKSPN